MSTDNERADPQRERFETLLDAALAVGPDFYSDERVAVLDAFDEARAATSPSIDPQERAQPVDWTKLADECELVIANWRPTLANGADGDHLGLYDLIEKEELDDLIDHVRGWLVHDAPKLAAAARPPAAPGESEPPRALIPEQQQVLDDLHRRRPPQCADEGIAARDEAQPSERGAR